MSRIARNAPCPCGSGVKYKRCCSSRERELAREADALEVLVGLGSLFPLMRPCGGDFEPWLAAHATSEPDRETIDAGLALLTEDEGRALLDTHASAYPDVWQGLGRDVGGAETAEPAALVGAITAALGESRHPDALALALIADERDRAEALAFAIDATNLWSIAESLVLDAALAELDEDLDDDAYAVLWQATVEREARRLWTDAHARRLDVLVERLRAQLSTLKPKAAARVLSDACAAYAEDERMRGRLGALLLSDTLGPLFNLSLQAAA